jgi:hypothetical protein
LLKSKLKSLSGIYRASAKTIGFPEKECVCVWKNNNQDMNQAAALAVDI